MDIIRSLKTISAEYAVFEKDQLLTHIQLNSIADFLDDESRLSRINLLGVGIVSGLRVSSTATTITVTGGLGITTDGDLLYLSQDMSSDRFRALDEKDPKYVPFLVGDQITPVYELIAAGVEDARATALERFSTQTEQTLDDMVVVFLMESYVTDRDICSGADCDNLGQDCRHIPKLLLVNKSSAQGLKEDVNTPHRAFGAFNQIVVARPGIAASAATIQALAEAFAAACTATRERIDGELGKIWEKCSPFLPDTFPSDPMPDWKASLDAVALACTSLEGGIQYYYDFLRDIAETFNAFRDLLFADNTWCCPDIEAFPKHLLLGDVVPARENDENRTGFYPSPALSRSADRIDHGRFLLRKIDAMIRCFQIPGSPVRVFEEPAVSLEEVTPTTRIFRFRPLVRITPSMSMEHPLEERAIPSYYRIGGTNPIYENWSYGLHRRGLNRSNYSSNAQAAPNAGEYRAEGPAAYPLTSDTGRFAFFRVEGHLGKDLHEALESIANQIRDNNLPFAARAVMAGADRSKLVRKPGIRYTDLHRFHYLLRQDVGRQLEDVVQFGLGFKEKVDAAVDNRVLTESPEDATAVAIKSTAANQYTLVSESASYTTDKLNRNYSVYKADTSWKERLPVTIRAAGEFKYNLSDVVKTEFTTPFDGLISSSHAHWLDWLDDIIRNKDEKEDEKLLLPQFITDHPGLEDYAGVTRGGTFVLVYDETSKVVGDFMLPYYAPDLSEDEPEEPPLTKPGLRPGWIVDNGVTIRPPREKFVRGKLEDFEEQHLGDVVKTADLDRLVDNKFVSFKYDEIDKIHTTIQNQFVSQQRDYLDALKDSVNTMSSVIASTRGAAVDGVRAATIQDPELAQRVADTKTKQSVVEYLRQKATQPDVPEERRKVYEEQAQEAEMELADSVSATTEYVAGKVESQKMNISVGSDGMAALAEMSMSAQTIKAAEAQARVASTIENVRKGTTNAGLNVILGNMTGRGIG